MNQISLNGFMLLAEIANHRASCKQRLINPPVHVQLAMEHHFVPTVWMLDSLDKMILLPIDM